MRRTGAIFLILTGLLVAAWFPPQETVAPAAVVGPARSSNLAAGSPGPRGEGASRRAEVRALWVVRHTLASPQSIDRLIKEALENGYTDLIVQVRGRGDAYYRSTYEPRAALLGGQPPDFDPLDRVIKAAHPVGLRVHAWINLFLVADLTSLPSSSRHLVRRHPEWLMVPRGMAEEQPQLSPQSPNFAEQLLAFSRRNREDLEGLFATPAHPGLREWVVRLALELVRRYEVDGLHLDYVRYPNPTYDFSRASLDQFRAEMEARLPEDDREFLESESLVDPLFYPDNFPAQYGSFQRRQVDLLVERLSKEVKRVRPDLLLSAAVFADPQQASQDRFQDWPNWARRGWLDVLCPMAYTPETERFQSLLEGVRQVAAGRQVWIGIGAYRQGVEQAREKIAVARAAGVEGFVLFSYDSSVAVTPHNPSGDYLEQLRPLLLPIIPVARIPDRPPARPVTAAGSAVFSR
ncbi:MAG: glycoside hydrolase family 10 protein [Blastocatellia bacterium]